MCHVANLGRGSAFHQDSEQLLVDWELGIIFHCKLILHHENLKDHLYNSIIPATPVFVK